MQLSRWIACRSVTSLRGPLTAVFKFRRLLWHASRRARAEGVGTVPAQGRAGKNGSQDLKTLFPSRLFSSKIFTIL